MYVASQDTMDAGSAGSFVVAVSESALPNHRVLSGTANQVIVTDDAGGKLITLSLPQDIHTGASPQFAGMTLTGVMSIGSGYIYGVSRGCLIRGGGGDAETPVYSFWADGNTGIYSNVADTLKFTVGGILGLTLDVNGLIIPNGTPPVSGPVNGFTLYSSDQIAGNACPTFMSENGAVIQLVSSHHNNGNNYAISDGTSLVALTTGYRNICWGEASGASVTTSFDNVLIGNSAGFRIEEGRSNVAIGYLSSARMGVGSSYNVSIGVNSGYGVSISHLQTYNTSIGAQAGSSFSNNSSLNTLIGFRAGFDISNGTNNIVIGASGASSQYDTSDPSADYELNIGNCLYGQLDKQNIGIGVTPDNFDGTGTHGLYMANGTPPVSGITDGFVVYSSDHIAGNACPTFICENGGVIQLISYPHASFETNIAIGEGTSFTNISTTAYGNTALGAGALENITNSNRNVAIGSQVLTGITSLTSYFNVAMGYQAGQNYSISIANTLIGNRAGGVNLADVRYTTVIGALAGISLVTNSTLNTLIGFRAGYNISTGTNNIVIGALGASTQYDTSVPTASYELNIGNCLYGQLDNSNIGIGVTPTDYPTSLTFGLIMKEGVAPTVAPASGQIAIFVDTFAGDPVLRILNPNNGGVALGEGISFSEVTVAPDDVANWGQLYTMNGNNLYFIDGNGNTELIVRMPVAGYTRHIHIAPIAATLGATAPTRVFIGTFPALEFSRLSDDECYFDIHVPSDWVGDTSPVLHIYWAPQTGIPESDTVNFSVDWRTKIEGEVIDGGNVTSTYTTYTQQGGAGTAKELIETELTMAYGAGDNPIVAGDIIGIRYYRQATTGLDTFDDEIYIIGWHWEYLSEAMPEI